MPAIKRRVDISQKLYQYILTGSLQWAVLQMANESLAGRVIFLELEGLSLAELANIVDRRANWLERYLVDPVAFYASAPSLTCRHPQRT
jgi:predicted AAA+ superfamily ATPase